MEIRMNQLKSKKMMRNTDGDSLIITINKMRMVQMKSRIMMIYNDSDNLITPETYQVISCQCCFPILLYVFRSNKGNENGPDEK